MVTSGANASLEQTKLAGSAFSIIVGWKNAPSAAPPARTRAPSATAWSIHDCVRNTAFSSIIGPRSVVRVERIAELDRLDGGDELVAEPFVDLLDDKDALHRDADLTGVGESADLDAVDREVEIGIASRR